MNNMKNIYSLLGISQKAGKVVSGETKTEWAVRRGKVNLVIIAADSSENTIKKFITLCQNYNVEYRVFGEKDKIGHSIGKNRRAVIAISDPNLTKVIIAKIDSKQFC
ncbi:putative ribosomal protein YlxQ [Koleobacter methoxysyntrophicus]|uniref:Putative ribosomal protein YlxQ n=2 Tax=Koleobacter methoxysyntrophicus TaxID=2751313 RepID=A0A8A0RNF3_9FIRM|nr:hypothetical protein [Thermosediminibacterales bacterium]MDK2901593.1 hypothetical protein [Thermosediminibacterales bacterium]QSQ09935.1 putative ribosomal protein YlxQ [Koleobacter methoxysyntrophicus]